MRLRVKSVFDAVGLRNYLRESGFVSYIDSTVLEVVHVAGSCDSYAEHRLLVTRTLGEWERESGSVVEVLDLKDGARAR
jgi:hypothetical protein